MPGLIRNGPLEDIVLVEDIVREYMSQPRNIILCMMRADDDEQNQCAFQMAK